MKPLSEKHKILLERVREAFELREELVARSFANPGERMRALDLLRSAPVSPQEFSAKILQAVDSSDDPELIRLAADEYWPEELAVSLLRELEISPKEAELIHQIHEARAKDTLLHLGRFTPKAWAGAVLAALSLLATQVPTSIATWVGWSYETYRETLFWVMVASLLWVTLEWLPRHREIARWRLWIRLTDAVVVLCVALARREESAPPQST